MGSNLVFTCVFYRRIEGQKYSVPLKYRTSNNSERLICLDKRRSQKAGSMKNFVQTYLVLAPVACLLPTHGEKTDRNRTEYRCTICSRDQVQREGGNNGLSRGRPFHDGEKQIFGIFLKMRCLT